MQKTSNNPLIFTAAHNIIQSIRKLFWGLQCERNSSTIISGRSESVKPSGQLPEVDLVMGAPLYLGGSNIRIRTPWVSDEQLICKRQTRPRF